MEEDIEILPGRLGEDAALVVEVDAGAAAVDTGVIRVPCRHNPVLADVVRQVNEDVELRTLWKCANVNAVDRLGISDHGRVHVQIVANIGLKMLRLLVESGVVPSVVRDYGLTLQDAEVVVVLAALLHDIGIAVHRDDHEHHSLFAASAKLSALLDGVYDVPARTIIWSEVEMDRLRWRIAGTSLNASSTSSSVALIQPLRRMLGMAPRFCSSRLALR